MGPIETNQRTDNIRPTMASSTPTDNQSEDKYEPNLNLLCQNEIEKLTMTNYAKWTADLLDTCII